jgi:chromosomal replication initiation ATPase DnaA
MTTLHEIRAAVMDYYSLTESQFNTRRRRPVDVAPRQVYCHLARRHTGKTSAQIGRPIARHYSTVVGNIKAVESRLATDTALADDLRAIEARL